MSNLKIPVGISDFAKIRVNDYYYVDKSGLIEELLKTESTEVTLITRPRRFGKTLVASMLAEFFDIRKDNADLFQGLKVARNRALCEAWRNQWPTLFLTFKSVDGRDFTDAFGMLAAVISSLCLEHIYLSESDTIHPIQKEVFIRLARKTASLEEIKNSLVLLTQMMTAYYGKPVILLIDEYDVPLAKSSSNGFYEDMLNVIRGLLGQALKDNSSLKFAVVTGCLRIAKESIFTGTNNLVSNTISDERFNEYFGFTAKDVEKLLQEANLTNHDSEIRDWYDGYHFGKMDVYCPWDVMNHVNALLQNPDTVPKGYWDNTSDNAIIRSFVDRTDLNVNMKFETLLSGGYIVQKIVENLTYDVLNSSEDNLWSVLYLTGYLTQVQPEKLDKRNGVQENDLILTIPNREIMNIFRETIFEWFKDFSKIWDKKVLLSGVWHGNPQEITKELTKLLRKTISYYDYKEDFYHAFLAGIFTGAGYSVESNKEYGEGRSDVVVQDFVNGRVAVFEIKHSKKREDLMEDCEIAIAQIDDKHYADQFMDDYDKVVCYGISFFRKQCLVLQKD